jgi:hypothetical protein
MYPLQQIRGQVYKAPPAPNAADSSKLRHLIRAEFEESGQEMTSRSLRRVIGAQIPISLMVAKVKMANLSRNLERTAGDRTHYFSSAGSSCHRGCMRILVTGSSGWLGQTLVPRLIEIGHHVVGLDPVTSETTRVVGSVADRNLVRAMIREFAVDAIIHAGALHKPHIETANWSDFVSVNVQGTLNLLEEAVAPGSTVDRFIFTSTTSLMISRDVRSGRSSGATKAAWITEELAPLRPRNIYDVTKLSAEHLCRLFHEIRGLPVVILRTSRFFPEEDDMAHAIA